LGVKFYPTHTPTIDVGFVLSGQLELILEKGSMVLGPGDCFVQRGTPHGWKVVGDEPAVIVCAMIAAKWRALRAEEPKRSEK
jgi:quercetin dioxygenase-like cupin family protein